MRSLEQEMARHKVLFDAPAQERADCIDFLKMMLRLKPTERANTETLLQHRWLN